MVDLELSNIFQIGFTKLAIPTYIMTEGHVAWTRDVVMLSEHVRFVPGKKRFAQLYVRWKLKVLQSKLLPPLGSFVKGVASRDRS
jgi:hypothetical protein